MQTFTFRRGHLSVWGCRFLPVPFLSGVAYSSRFFYLNFIGMATKKKAIKTLLIVLGAILLLLIITNPGIKRFKDFKGETSYRGLKRTSNWLILSFYEDSNGNTYLGMVLNFFETGAHFNGSPENNHERILH